MTAKKDNLVTVRIWNSGLKGGENVGHISIQTSTTYMSLWPASSKMRKSEVFLSRGHNLIPNPEEDIVLEDGRHPEKIYCLYTLDKNAIEARFRKITEGDQFKGWTLFGDAGYLINESNTHSCATLAYTLLTAGGLYQLASRLQSSRVSSVVTPDQLGEVVKQAKQAELYTEPVTKKFTFPNETDVTPQSWGARITPYLACGAGFFAVSAIALAVAAQNESCPEVLEDVCCSIRGFTG